jgi:tetratricopeptide (TPR) repeat protein
MAQRRLLILLPLLTALTVGACHVLPEKAECFSIDGIPLRSQPADAATQTQREADLAAAEAKWRGAPEDKEAAIWYARRLGYVGRFRDAVRVLSETLDFHPGDAFLLRHRGHRWITLREFGKAALDLERAAAACRTTVDEVEPDGQPTPGRPPHSSLHYNVHYHLGLALFLARDFELAERAWLACLAIARNDESRVAVTHWLWCVRIRLGDVAGAQAVVAPIHESMDVVENVAYLNLCLLYGGKKARTAIEPRTGSSGSALAFGLAHYEMVTGDRKQARRELRELRDSARTGGWAAFGVIAAEVELDRWRD